MVNKDLAGGALLDIGIYALTWVFQTLYHTQPGQTKEAPKVLAAVDQYAATGADEMTSIICHFPGNSRVGIATTGLRVATDPDGQSSGGPPIRIQGSRGEIQVSGPAYRPLQYKVIRKEADDGNNDNGGARVEVVDCAIPQGGSGMFWEADECARCLRDGKKQSTTMPWEESIVIMETMDSVLKQGGVTYPELITTDVYDAQSPLNTGKQ